LTIYCYSSKVNDYYLSHDYYIIIQFKMLNRYNVFVFFIEKSKLVEKSGEFIYILYNIYIYHMWVLIYYFIEHFFQAYFKTSYYKVKRLNFNIPKWKKNTSSVVYSYFIILFSIDCFIIFFSNSKYFMSW